MQGKVLAAAAAATIILYIFLILTIPYQAKSEPIKNQPLTITHPNPLNKNENTPVIPMPTNYAAIPDFWTYTGTTETTAWTISSPDATWIHYPTTHETVETIELNPGANYMAIAAGWGGLYELDGKKTPISPGDTVTLNIWLLNENATTTEDNGVYGPTGSNVGIDLWAGGVDGRICEVRTFDGTPTYPTYPSLTSTNIPFGTLTVTKITISFVVAAQYMADPWGGFTAGTMVTPLYVIPWIVGVSSDAAHETARTWIVATELFVTPEPTPPEEPAPGEPELPPEEETPIPPSPTELLAQIPDSGGDTVIDYSCIKPGLSDHTPLDDLLDELEKQAISTCWIDYRWIKPGLADRTPLDEALDKLEE